MATDLEAVRALARHLNPPKDEKCPLCDHSVGYVCEECSAASYLLDCAREIEELRHTIATKEREAMLDKKLIESYQTAPYIRVITGSVNENSM